MSNAAERARNAYLHRASRKRRHARMVQQMGGVCVRCGSTDNLEIHHKTKRFKRNARCGDTNIADAIRDPEGTQILCRACNLRAERGQLLGRPAHLCCDCEHRQCCIPRTGDWPGCGWIADTSTSGADRHHRREYRSAAESNPVPTEFV
jgi:hypothetical protein